MSFSPFVRLLSEKFADENGILYFDYQHVDIDRNDIRKWISVRIRWQEGDISYGGSPWHGIVSERRNYDMQRVFFEFLDGQQPHQLVFYDFHSPYGIPQALLFYQVGPFCWRAKHRKGATLYLVLRKDHETGRVPIAESNVAIALDDITRDWEVV